MARNFSKEDAPLSNALISYIPLMPGLQVIETSIRLFAFTQPQKSFISAQFFIYFAWLCFGRAAVDPFGDDEDDINVKQLVQSHIEVQYCHKCQYLFKLEISKNRGEK